MWPGHKLQAVFNFPRILCKKHFQEFSMLIWKEFENLHIHIHITYPLQVACLEKFIFQ